MDQVNADAWIGRTATETGGISQASAGQIHATLGRAGTNAPLEGDLLPGLWHWCAFPQLAHMSDLGTDGHPGPGEMMPPLHLRRRMWAGGALRFHAPLRVGDPLTRRSTLCALTPKETAAGPMMIVTLDVQVSGPQGLAIEERQDIVYLNIPGSFTPPRKQPMPAPVSEQVATPETLLFRYSALTFNAHRIHYDLTYTREVEHYPGLVVHGPLQASLLMRAAVEARGRLPESFEFRAVHPLFSGTDMDIAMREEDGALHLFTGQSGHQGMRATALWEAAP